MAAERGGSGGRWTQLLVCLDEACLARFDELQAIADDCENRYSAGVVAAFIEATRFRGTTAGREATLACLKREGIVAESFTIGMLQLLEIETAPPATCDEMLNDPRFIDVTCDEDGSFGGLDNPDFVFTSRMVPGGYCRDSEPLFSCRLSHCFRLR